MKKIIVVLCICFLASCVVEDDSDLTGVWRLEYNNILYSIHQVEQASGVTQVSFNVCNGDAPWTLEKSGSSLTTAFQKEILVVNNSSQLEFVTEGAKGFKLNKVSDNPVFSSGALSISSDDQVLDLNATQNVCAYRETDGMYNVIAAPYAGGYVSLTLGVDKQATGVFSVSDGVSLDLSSSSLFDDDFIVASSGYITVSRYTASKLEASFSVVASDGNEYTGEINVDL